VVVDTHDAKIIITYGDLTCSIEQVLTAIE